MRSPELCLSFANIARCAIPDPVNDTVVFGLDLSLRTPRTDVAEKGCYEPVF